MAGWGSPRIFAHRGASRDAPENTLPAFALALDHGADGIELDVHLSRDGRLVVIHDLDVDATTNGHGPVASFTSAELARLDAGSHLDQRFAGVGVPTLDDVLDLVGDRCVVNVEIKSDAADGGPAADVLARLLARRRLFDQVIVSSANPRTLARLRPVDAIALGLVHAAPLTAQQLGELLTPSMRLQALHPDVAVVTRESVAWAHAHGLAVNVWTVNDVAEARRLADLGVDGLITDVPGTLIREAF